MRGDDGFLVRDPATGRIRAILPDGKWRKPRKVMKVAPVTETIPPPPYFITTDGHTHLVAADGRMIARLWGQNHERGALAVLLARAPAVEAALRAIDPTNEALGETASPRPQARRPNAARRKDLRSLSFGVTIVVPFWMTRGVALRHLRKRLRAMDDTYAGLVEETRARVVNRRGPFFVRRVI